MARTGACPSWSPSGAAIAYLGFNPLGKSSLRIVPASGGVSTLLVRRAGIGCPSWSHDSRTLAAVDSRTGKLLVVDPATHAARAVAPNVLHEVIDFAWSPDASELLVIARPTPRSCSSLWLVAATTGKARLLRSCS